MTPAQARLNATATITLRNGLVLFYAAETDERIVRVSQRGALVTISARTPNAACELALEAARQGAAVRVRQCSVYVLPKKVTLESPFRFSAIDPDRSGES